MKDTTTQKKPFVSNIAKELETMRLLYGCYYHPASCDPFGTSETRRLFVDFTSSTVRSEQLSPTIQKKKSPYSSIRNYGELNKKVA